MSPRAGPHVYWAVRVAAKECWSHLGGGQDKGGEGAGHPARAEEVDGEPGEHLHGQDVAQQESEEGGLGLKQLHVLSCLAQGSEVLNQLGLPRPNGWSAMEAALPSPPPTPGCPGEPPTATHAAATPSVRPKGYSPRDGGARAPAWGLSWGAGWWQGLTPPEVWAHKKQRKAELGKPLEPSASKPSVSMGMLDPEQEGASLQQEGKWNMANAGPAKPGPWAPAGLLQLYLRLLPGKGRQTQPRTRVPRGVMWMALLPAMLPTPPGPRTGGLASTGAPLTFWGPSWLGSSGASSPISRGCRNLRTKLRSWWKAWKAS